MILRAKLLYISCGFQVCASFLFAMCGWIGTAIWCVSFAIVGWYLGEWWTNHHLQKQGE